MFLKSFDGINVFYKIKRGAKKEVLIFVHGCASNWTAWKKEADFFQNKNYSTVLMDLRGHGKSGKPEKKEQYALECFAKDIDEIVKKEKIKSFALVGHSMGGMISLMYYKMFSKKVDALILCDTTCKNFLIHTKIKKFCPFIKSALDFLALQSKINKEKKLKPFDMTKYTNRSDYAVVYRELVNTPSKSVFSCLESMLNYDMKPFLGKIKIPTLIIEGSKDKILPAVNSFEMYKGIKNSELHFIVEGQHFVNLAYPKVIDMHILNFLEKHGLKR